LVSIIVVFGTNMFDNIAKQLELQSLGKGKSDFKIDEQEFEQFCKNFLFEQIKGDKKLGQYFCEKYNETNHVLSILNDKAAKNHIKTFYVR
jgi:hypothetical protein